MNLKRCPKCGETKPLSEFYKKKGGRGGVCGRCKTCILIERADYRAENRERLRVEQAEYRAQYPDRRKAADAKYYVAHKDEKLAANAKWRIKNPDKVKILSARYRTAHLEKERERSTRNYAENPRKARAATARWHAANPEKEREHKNNRRARKQNAEGYASAEQIIARCQLYGQLCYLCGNPAEAVDHVIPLSAGGSNWPSNLRPICKRCNSVKGAKWPYVFPSTTRGVGLCA